MFGKDFTATPCLLWMIMGSAVIEVASGALYQATFARPSLGWQVVAISVWSALLLGLTRTLVPFMGPDGLAASYAVAHASSALIYLQLRGSTKAQRSK